MREGRGNSFQYIFLKEAKSTLFATTAQCSCDEQYRGHLGSGNPVGVRMSLTGRGAARNGKKAFRRAADQLRALWRMPSMPAGEERPRMRYPQVTEISRPRGKHGECETATMPAQ